MMCSNNFYPKIMFPTRIAKRSYSLLDQVFCKVPCKEQADISASILLSGISDNFPCVVNFKILNKKPRPPRYVYKRSITESSLDQYRSDLRSLNIHTHLKADLMTDPNASYQIFENLIQTSYQRHFPEKRVKFNKYQHKLSNWITTGILKSIEFRDNLYKRLKLCAVDNFEYDAYKHNLKVYQGYLNQCIRTAKSSPNIKTISEKHGTHLKAPSVRIRWNRNIRPFLWTWVSRYREIKISQTSLMNISHKSDRAWQIQLISPTRQHLTHISRSQTRLLFNFSIQIHLMCRKSSTT